MRDAKLNRIDLNILAQLQRDGRPSNVELAERAGRRIESARRPEARCIGRRSLPSPPPPPPSGGARRPPVPGPPRRPRRLALRRRCPRPRSRRLAPRAHARLPRHRLRHPRPDWVCEILSPSTRRFDLTEKRALYAANAVAHLWLVDPEARTLEAFTLTDGRWTLSAAFQEGDEVRTAPFETLGFPLGALWPD